MVDGVIYLLLNTINGKMYVGQTKQAFKRRIAEHKRNSKKANSGVDAAIRKYGWKKFRCFVIKNCASKAEMDTWEKFFIILLNTKKPNGYNLTDGGEGIVGLERTPEHNAKISAANTGKRHSLKSRAIMSKAHTGKTLSPEHCAHIGDALRSVPKTLEHCAHISAGQRYDSPYKNLIAEMDKQKLSYSALAKLLEVAHQNISRKMLGQRNFTAKDKAKLVEIFNKPIEYLLFKEEF